MTDIVASVFELKNDRGLFVPLLDMQYTEKDKDIKWFINCGVTRAYLIRIGSDLGSDIDAECADSHFMVNRVVTSLFMSGLGLFEARAMGRIFFENIKGDEFRFHSHFDVGASEEKGCEKEIAAFGDWYKFICVNILFRRAADDAYSALLNPVESTFYIYRAMEWLLEAGGVGWRELAEDMGVTFNQIKDFKRIANRELGQRHGIASARKERARIENYAPLVADLVNGICKVRKRVDAGFQVPTPQEVSDIVMKALHRVPYP